MVCRCRALSSSRGERCPVRVKRSPVLRSVKQSFAGPASEPSSVRTRSRSLAWRRVRDFAFAGLTCEPSSVGPRARQLAWRWERLLSLSLLFTCMQGGGRGAQQGSGRGGRQTEGPSSLPRSIADPYSPSFAPLSSTLRVGPRSGSPTPGYTRGPAIHYNSQLFRLCPRATRRGKLVNRWRRQSTRALGRSSRTRRAGSQQAP